MKMDKCKITWDVMKFVLGMLSGGAVVYSGVITTPLPEIKLSCPKAVLSCPKCPGYVVQPTIKETCR